LRIGGRNTANPHWVPRHGRETRQFACAAAVAVAVAVAAAVGDVAVAVAGSCVAWAAVGNWSLRCDFGAVAVVDDDAAAVDVEEVGHP